MEPDRPAAAPTESADDCPTQEFWDLQNRLGVHAQAIEGASVDDGAYNHVAVDARANRLIISRTEHGDPGFEQIYRELVPAAVEVVYRRARIDRATAEALRALFLRAYEPLRRLNVRVTSAGQDEEGAFRFRCDPTGILLTPELLQRALPTVQLPSVVFDPDAVRFTPDGAVFRKRSDSWDGLGRRSPR